MKKKYKIRNLSKKKKKNTKQPATYENRKIFDMKLVITEHPKLYMNYPRL